MSAQLRRDAISSISGVFVIAGAVHKYHDNMTDFMTREGFG